MLVSDIPSTTRTGNVLMPFLAIFSRTLKVRWRQRPIWVVRRYMLLRTSCKPVLEPYVRYTMAKTSQAMVECSTPSAVAIRGELALLPRMPRRSQRQASGITCRASTHAMPRAQLAAST